MMMAGRDNTLIHIQVSEWKKCVCLGCLLLASKVKVDLSSRHDGKEGRTHLHILPLSYLSFSRHSSSNRVIFFGVLLSSGTANSMRWDVNFWLWLMIAMKASELMVIEKKESRVEKWCETQSGRWEMMALYTEARMTDRQVTVINCCRWSRSRIHPPSFPSPMRWTSCTIGIFVSAFVNFVANLESFGQNKK